MPTIIPRTRKKQEARKISFLEVLEKVPVICIACQKLSIGRTTYYNWVKDDAAFADLAEEAITAGRENINQLAESKLISKIQGGNLGAIIFWLKNNCDRYRSKVQIEAYMQNTDLTEEQKNLLLRSLKLSEPSHHTWICYFRH